MLLKAGAVSLALLLTSRLLGMVRESVQAAAFGTSGLGDVAVLMLTLPDWFAGLLASGALSYVLLPYWARQPAAQHAASQRRLAVWLLAGGAAAGLLLWLGRDAMAVVLAAGVPADLKALAGRALAFSAAAVPLALLAALWTTRLQFERDFTGMYGANLVVNLLLIAALAALATRPEAADASMVQLGFCLVAAMVARLLWLGWRQRSQEPVPGLVPGLGEAARRDAAPPAVPPFASPAAPAPFPRAGTWFWAVLVAGLPLALPFVARSIASQAGEGELATFNYAWKLVELPLILAIQLVAVLSFPAIARAFAGDGDPGTTVRQAFALAWALACAAAAALLVGAPAVAQLLFGWGRMTDASLQRLAAWAALGAWGLLPQALIAVSLVVLASRNRMRPMVIAYAAALGLLLLAAPWTEGDGGRLMLVLNFVLAGVAAAAVASLGARGRGWVPWRAMVLPAALLAATAGATALAAVPAILRAAAPAAGLAAALAVALLVLGASFSASADMRRALRR